MHCRYFTTNNSSDGRVHMLVLAFDSPLRRLVLFWQKYPFTHLGGENLHWKWNNNFFFLNATKTIVLKQVLVQHQQNSTC